MRLLFDHNLSPRLLPLLVELFPGSAHVRDVGLHTGSDEAVWAYAAQNGFAIVSKDADFRQRSFLFGHPPKVIWIRRGNCSTRTVAEILKQNHAEILSFGQSETGAFLALG